MSVEIDAVHNDWERFRIWIRSHDPTKGGLIARFELALLYCSSDENDYTLNTRLTPHIGLGKIFHGVVTDFI
ncbi:hypothetical protein Lepto7375DRAFT_8281 [Leptolyngbya sp. PCC 7375]|nr:hypothetical protein Lepto7375DRAFT_8281 [Leptolyngbya sp. PCC 7375]